MSSSEEDDGSSGESSISVGGGTGASYGASTFKRHSEDSSEGEENSTGHRGPSGFDRRFSTASSMNLDLSEGAPAGSYARKDSVASTASSSRASVDLSRLESVNELSSPGEEGDGSYRPGFGQSAPDPGFSQSAPGFGHSAPGFGLSHGFSQSGGQTPPSYIDSYNSGGRAPSYTDSSAGAPPSYASSYTPPASSSDQDVYLEPPSGRKKRRRSSSGEDERKAFGYDGGAIGSRPSYTASKLSADGGIPSMSSSMSSSMTSSMSSSLSSGGASNSAYDAKAMRMMASMGYKSGMGLGKEGQGIKAPVKESKQKGRHGLGHTVAGFEPTDDLQWQQEKVILVETVDWLPHPGYDLDLDTMRKWVKVGPPKMDIADETQFVSAEALDKMLDCKSIFDNLEGEEMRRARTRSNPFETIRSGIFLNRAAMKMANMDQRLEFIFTSPKNRDGTPAVREDDLLYFADICAGPGGFTEYVLWRKQWKCHGFGLTLKSGANDFKMGDMQAGPSECFEPYYGVGGAGGDGDIYREDNMREFEQYVRTNSEGKGVHFVMADGGFSVEGQENIQEILSKRLYLCQFLCALRVLREGGHFVCKLFDIFTSFSAGLVYLMWHVFDDISIIKPVTSRPANSERYIVCRYFRADIGRSVIQYMIELNNLMEQQGFGRVNKPKKDINHCVPLDYLLGDSANASPGNQDGSHDAFFRFLYDSNEIIIRDQIHHLEKLRAYGRNSDLHETRQSSIRQQCLELWRVPDKPRVAPKKWEARDAFDELTKREGEEVYGRLPSELTLDGVCADMGKIVWNCRFVVSGSELTSNDVDGPFYLLGLGKHHTFYRTIGGKSSIWRKLPNTAVELPRLTLLWAELVTELRGEGKAQRRVKAVHVLDALSLCGEDVRHLHYNLRMSKAALLAMAIRKESAASVYSSASAPLRVKTVYKMEELPSAFDLLTPKIVKGRGSAPRLCYGEKGGAAGEVGKGVCYMPRGLYFTCIVSKPWIMSWSRSARKKYYYNIESRVSSFDTPRDAVAGAGVGCKERMVWDWAELIEKREMEEGKEKVLDALDKHIG